MKIIYKKKMTDKILEACAEAARSYKEVERIELDRDEWNSFRCEIMTSYRIACPPSRHRLSNNEIEFNGVIVALAPPKPKSDF